MTKPYTEDDLASQLSQDVAWRVREISDLKAAVHRADATAKNSLLRALVTICYAHWEGHVKFSAQKFMQHITLRKFQFSALDRQFLKNHFLPRLGSLAQKGIFDRSELIDLILDSGNDRFSKINDDLINTRSNLNYEVLLELCHVCGINGSLFEEKSTFIDVVLLKRRNSIAHGEDTLVGVEEIDSLPDDTIGLMRTFSNELQTKAYLKGYMAA
ncbi:hypothetical protein BWQ93_01430 [Sphingopyxis sp. QXT-31]|uniref:MAE_28990/MAE_18760 family HEPN-like nuclease n=1 Tax=Sphingopyxis sp. QXT-31 TaxID=1357916 RepID=UPI0009797F64|nr:MAE_28990/MAE_18760 family HEPN-like nuclease [Sphingopyxis sp. QXT-31]APZ97300.1 hypothetical protein BWQ93_01430 [Sphingopyxis sp. QXT-31]